MALQHLRSSTANKRPTPAAMSDGQIALNSNTASPGLFFKDSAGALIKVGPVHVGTTAPNASPASGGETGNTVGEQWLDTTGGTYVFKVWDGSAWRSETGTFVDVNGDTMTGNLVMDNANIVFEGSTADDFETTLTVTDPTADRTITLPDVTGTVVTTGDTGSVTSTMIADGTIVDADVNASAAIAGTKIDPDFGSQTVETTGVFSAAGGAEATPSITFTGDLNTGIYSPGADQLAISTNGTGRLTIDGSGNINVDSGGLYYDATTNRLAIGTTSPADIFNVKTTSSRHFVIRSGAAPKVYSQNDSGNVEDLTIGGNNLFFFTGTGASGTERMALDSSGRLLVGTSTHSGEACNVELAGSEGGTINLRRTDDSIVSANNLGIINFIGDDPSAGKVGATIRAVAEGSWNTDDYPSRLEFSTTADGASSPTERMRIAQDGRQDHLSDTAFFFRSKLSSSTSTAFGVRRDATTIQSGTEIFTVRTNGGIANYSANDINLSDRNVKKDISLAADTWDCVKEWEIVNYRYKDQADDADLNLGVIAQQVAESCPEVITVFEEAKDDQPERLGVKEQQMYWMAIKALQEAQVRIEALEAEVATLKAQ